MSAALRHIRPVSLLLGMTALIASTTVARAATVQPDDPRLSYEGRYAVGPAHDVRLGFPGITLRLRVNASAVRLKLHASSNDVFFKLSVDGQPARKIRVHQGDSEIPLLAASTAAEHAIELIRITESWEGVCEFTGLDVDGTILPPPALPSRKLLFIGDSITCGEGVVPNAPGLTAPERTDATESYGMKLARRLGAQCELVSYGGRGVIRDWQGIRATNNAPQFYELALPDDPKTRWNPATYVPDAIGICLGTNDFSQGIPDENEFVNAYVEFIRKIQRDAPHAPIFLIDSPILTDADIPKRTVCGAYLDEVIRKVDSPLLHHAHLRHYQGSEGDGHPVAAEQTSMTDELEPVFRKALGW
ncbi:MAG TPA: GDSL-type esterase/lipase family protein [Opitutaceae bacterium]|nr:GDSL-type esterase/lipase family protein [Opitutaceae bacterium]